MGRDNFFSFPPMFFLVVLFLRLILNYSQPDGIALLSGVRVRESACQVANWRWLGRFGVAKIDSPSSSDELMNIKIESVSR